MILGLQNIASKKQTWELSLWEALSLLTVENHSSVHLLGVVSGTLSTDGVVFPFLKGPRCSTSGSGQEDAQKYLLQAPKDQLIPT